MKIQNILTLAATAALITSASASVTMDWVNVGNPGNAADPLTGYGSVAYEYKIGKYEVTNAQYGAFLNAVGQTDTYGIYDPRMGNSIGKTGTSGNYTYSVNGTFANNPVVYVSWYDAARFANWMMNGQGSGDTETGAYTLNGLLWGVVLANSGAQVYIPTENEWYKAAYYNGETSRYSLYPNGQNTITMADANYGSSSFTPVGSYISDSSYYGTFDQGGNAEEWNDAVVLDEFRGRRGGSIGVSAASPHPLNALSRDGYGNVDYGMNGFRLASINAVPEPTSIVLTMLASGVMLIRRKR
jgi:sulfatase modifying factor 1